MSRALSIFLALVLLFLTSIEGVSVPTSFVTHNGSTLFLDGKPWKFSGANAYWLGLDENVPGPDGSKIQYPTQFRVEDALITAAGMGANVVRAHTLGISVGNPKSFEPSRDQFQTEAMDHILFAIKTARELGIRLIIPLVDNWAYYHGGKHTFVDWQNITGIDKTSCFKTDPPTAALCAFYTNQTVINSFKKYVSQILSTKVPWSGQALVNEPTILAWETGNELIGLSNNWTRDLTNFIRHDLQAKQLIMTGRDIYAMGINPEWAQDSNIDLVTDHYYPMSTDRIVQDSKAANAAGKVFTIGEYGWSKGDLESFLSTVEANQAVAGDLYWSLFPHADTYGYVQHNDGYTLHFPGDTDDMKARVSMLRDHAFKMRGLSPPPYPVPGIPLITNTSCKYVAWRGATMADKYSIDRSYTSSQGPWSEICLRCVDDNQSPWLDSDRDDTKGAWYRVQAFNLDGMSGDFSHPVYSPS